MNLFIDTNIFLSFYSFSSDDLEELRKLSAILRKRKDIKLFLPEQEVFEFERNREDKIAEALKTVKEQRLNLQFPQLCKDYDTYNRLRAAQKEYEQAHTELLKSLDSDIASRSLKADSVTKELFVLAEKITTTPNLVERARLRCDIGNPPGKRGSLGDAINWESLLDFVPSAESIYFVTEDKDYRSAIDKSQFNPFLLDEWQKAKSSELVFYVKISDFFRDHFPSIKLASDYEKNSLIGDLMFSPNFARTHSIIAQLEKFSDFTLDETNEIIIAATLNNQINWILADTDVQDFLLRVIRDKEDLIDPSNLQPLEQMFANGGIEMGRPNLTPPPDEENIPF